MSAVDPARSFGTAADAYARARPTYPLAAVAWAIGAPPARVVDLGAGTGKLTAVCREGGYDVVAVEPDDTMRAVLQGLLPGVETHPGTAEAIPLPDASADAVVAGQAYHWFDRPRALPEIARVLRPGAPLGLLWNLRDEREPWVAELSAILRAVGDDKPNMYAEPGDDRPWFGAYEHRAFRHVVTSTPDGLRDLVASRSYVITAAPDVRATLDAAVDRLLARHPALADRDRFDVPYVTNVHRAVRAAP